MGYFKEKLAAFANVPKTVVFDMAANDSLS